MFQFNLCNHSSCLYSRHTLCMLHRICSSSTSLSPTTPPLHQRLEIEQHNYHTKMGTAGLNGSLMQLKVYTVRYSVSVTARMPLGFRTYFLASNRSWIAVGYKVVEFRRIWSFDLQWIAQDGPPDQWRQTMYTQPNLQLSSPLPSPLLYSRHTFISALILASKFFQECHLNCGHEIGPCEHATGQALIDISGLARKHLYLLPGLLFTLTPFYRFPFPLCCQSWRLDKLQFNLCYPFLMPLF